MGEWDACLCWRNASAARPSALQTGAVNEPPSAQTPLVLGRPRPGRQLDARLRGCWWSARWLLAFFLGGIGEEVIDQCGAAGRRAGAAPAEASARGQPAAAGAGLADAGGRRPARGGELDELGTAVAGVRYAVGVAGLLQPLHLPGDVRRLYPGRAAAPLRRQGGSLRSADAGDQTPAGARCPRHGSGAEPYP